MSLNPFATTRENHALEHATIAVLLRRLDGNVRLLGRATNDGFYIYGDISTEAVTAAAEEGLTRLRNGEAELAVSPLCGTNLMVTGILATFSSLIALGNKNRWRRLPHVLLATLGAVMVSQPLGNLVQKHITTSADVKGLRINRIIRKGKGMRSLHKVETSLG